MYTHLAATAQPKEVRYVEKEKELLPGMWGSSGDHPGQGGRGDPVYQIGHLPYDGRLVNRGAASARMLPTPPIPGA